MSIKGIFQNNLRQQEKEVAHGVIVDALKGGLSPKTKVGDLLKELKADDSSLLFDAFNDLTIGDLRQFFGASNPEEKPGPTRKRGVTSGRIIDHVDANPGARRGDVMRALGLKGGTVSSQLRMLRTKGLLRGEGPERDFRYYPA